MRVTTKARSPFPPCAQSVWVSNLAARSSSLLRRRVRPCCVPPCRRQYRARGNVAEFVAQRFDSFAGALDLGGMTSDEFMSLMRDS